MARLLKQMAMIEYHNVSSEANRETYGARGQQTLFINQRKAVYNVRPPNAGDDIELL